jgi:hypothetical protein
MSMIILLRRVGIFKDMVLRKLIVWIRMYRDC